MKRYGSLFFCHSSIDKPFVRKLAADLAKSGVRVWVDDAEIRLGESLIGRIQDAIASMDYLAVVLSPDAVESPWVTRELDVAMNHEIRDSRVRVLPLLYRECTIPGFLSGKLYADFTDRKAYRRCVSKLLETLAFTSRDDWIEQDRIVLKDRPGSRSMMDVKTNDPYLHLVTSREIERRLVFSRMDNFRHGNSKSAVLAEPADIYGWGFEPGDTIYFDDDGRIISVHAYRGELSC